MIESLRNSSTDLLRKVKPFVANYMCFREDIGDDIVISEFWKSFSMHDAVMADLLEVAQNILQPAL